MIIKRDILDKINKFIDNKQILALVGLRQVGKTTLLKEIQVNLKNTKYITLEDIETLQLFEENIEEFISLYVKPNDYLFIDEIQYCKFSGKQLKYIYDTHNIKIFISGSSKSELAIHSLQYLVGRVIVFDIYPLTFREFLRYKNKELLNYIENSPSKYTIEKLNPYFQEYLQYGGYPSIVIETDSEKKIELLKNIVNTYILKELKDILGYKNSFEFENLLKRLALNDGNLFNKSNVAAEIEINRNKINELVNILEKTGLITILRPYLKNKTKEIIKTPKVYFQDLGFKNSLINNFNKLELRNDKGNIYENFVLSQLIRKEITPSFYRIENDSEVDFVIERNGEITGIEVKSKLQSNKLSRASCKFSSQYSPKKLYILNENIYEKDKSIIFTHYLEVTKSSFPR